MDKSLSDLLKELPITDNKFEGLTFVSDNHRYIRMVEYIPKGEEDGFESMNWFVTEAIKELLLLQA